MAHMQLDPAVSGTIDYEALMHDLLDEDCYALYISGAAHAAERAPLSSGALIARQHAAAIHAKVAPRADKLRQVCAGHCSA